MKLLFNVFFEILHRKVYDKYYIHSTQRHKDNKITKKDVLMCKLYNYLNPYFKGWRYSIKINLFFMKKYLRYEPKNLDLLDYEFNNLSLWNKLIYSIRYESFANNK